MKHPFPPSIRVLPAAPASPPARTLPLNRIKPGTEIRITSIRVDSGKKDLLYAQGIVETLRARILHNDHKGRVMLRAGSDLFILGRLETPRIHAVPV